MTRIKKTTCMGCGLYYTEILMKQYAAGPYCDICEIDLIVEAKQNEARLVLPSYFLSDKHRS